MDKYNLLKDDDKNFYIINKSIDIEIIELIRLSKSDEKYFNKHKTKKLDNKSMIVAESNKVYEAISITILK